MILYSPKSKIINAKIKLPASKSISNRALIIKALCKENFKVKNLSSAEDTQLMINALSNPEKEIDIHHAGTCMRFLTSYFVATQQNKILTGSSRMKQRPIKILVDALKSIGAKINYAENEGYPPLEIITSELNGKQISLPANISSQYISALLLIAPNLPNGLQINFETEIVSESYIEMTLSMLSYFGINYEKTNQSILMHHQKYIAKDITIESDWSSASYWYSFLAFSDIGSKITLSGLTSKSWQGDAIVKDLYRALGVETNFEKNGVVIEKVHTNYPKEFEFDFSNCPDLAQTLAITTAILCKKAHLTGLQTLNIKESKRIIALENELKKIGIKTKSTSESLEITNSGISLPNLPFETYNDHRMAMCLAPLSLVFDKIEIKDPEVVNKSYLSFWEDVNLLM
jgi:3-phosphoshikimate 1-carboxyvinyltransferase